MKKIIALVLLLLISTTAYGAPTPSDWAASEIRPDMVSMLEALGVDIDYQRDITREEFCYLALKAYTDISGEPIPDLSIDNPFTDINSPFILIAYELGIIKGVSDTEFAPDNRITRQEMCVMLSRVLEKTVPELAGEEAVKAAQGSIDAYSDAPLVADWAKAYVEFAVKNEIMKGVSDTELNPLGNCSMEQAMVLCKRVINKYTK